MDVASHFQFIPKRMKGSPSKRIGDEVSDLGMNSKDINDEISELTKELMSLKATLSNHRDMNKDLCNNVLAEVSGVISIPPISSNKM